MAYVNALAPDVIIGPLYACDSTPLEVKSRWFRDLKGNIFRPFMGTGGGVASLTCRVLGAIIGVLEVKGLTNFTFIILGVVTSSE